MHAKTLDNSYLNIENISIEKLKKLFNENNAHNLDIFEDVNSLVFKLDRALLHKHSKAEFSPIHSNLRHNLGARST
ncbi:hypothetical protein J595_00545 [Acinetobacter sp. 1592897]|nr:hypothetical protein J594_0899 [Acinetobacter sp. 259052]EYT21123.1 hypothetical protein J595_00545 [Acinetobacter sp. 1592897]